MRISLTQKHLVGLSILLGVLFIFYPIALLHTCAQYIIETYMRLLRLLSLPILFFSILSTTTSLHASERWRGVFNHIVSMSFITTFCAAVIAALSFAIIQPTGQAIAFTPRDTVHVHQAFEHFIPDNIIQMFLSFNVIAIVGLGLVLGYATRHIPEDERLMLEKLAKALFGVFVYLARTLIMTLPYVLWAFILNGYTTLTTHIDAITELWSYVLTVIVANSIQGLIVLPILLKLHGLRPAHIFKQSLPALSLAFLSKSSAATLPISLRVCTDGLKIPHDFTAMSLPLCTSVNMNGCAAFIYISVHFVARTYGIEWTLAEHVLWVFLSIIAAFGNAGVPMGCYFMASAFLVMLNLPTEWMNLILPFYLFLDMYETAINVWSDISVVAIVATRYDEHGDHI